MGIECWTNRPNSQAQRVACPPINHAAKWGMAIENEEFMFNSAFCARVQKLRKAKFANADEMARLLGVPAERYRKYETRSPLPPHLIERFAALVGVDVQEVLIGRPYRPHASREQSVADGKKRA